MNKKIEFEIKDKKYERIIRIVDNKEYVLFDKKLRLVSELKVVGGVGLTAITQLTGSKASPPKTKTKTTHIKKPQQKVIEEHFTKVNILTSAAAAAAQEFAENKLAEENRKHLTAFFEKKIN
ncbi:MAG: hypothetical protein EBU66_17640 [Bacteroidetes bacterium]|nr:hypothetical protein [bacterium]NBP66455.1 hypothetical protein [Bacteroidota bacterium]